MTQRALLIMDYQPDILDRLQSETPQLITSANALIAAARAHKTLIIFIRVGFRKGYPEANSNNKLFADISKSGRLQLGSSGVDIHPEINKLPDDIVVTKHRVGAFAETELQTLLRASQIQHLILAGVSTSGVVLSTLRVAADLDYQLTVVADACADTDSEVHRVLIEKIFPRQAEVVTARAAALQLSRATVATTDSQTTK